MFIRIFHFLCGYVRFLIVGEFPERLLNMLSNNGVTIWDIVRTEKGIEAKMTLKNYFSIRKNRGKSHIRTRAQEKKGIPILIKKYRYRVGFATGFIIFFIVLHFLSGCIWNVCITGNVNIPDSEILEACNEIGIHEGIKRTDIDSDGMPSKIMLRVDGLAWVSLNVEGVRLTVNVSEAKTVEMNEKTPSNLVATRDGVIYSYMIDNGNILMKRGQAVKAGEILVSGAVTYADGSSRFVHSKGSIIAETEREISSYAGYVQHSYITVGKPDKKTVIKFLGLDIPLYLGSHKGLCKTQVQNKRFYFGEGYLPLEITDKTFWDVKEYSYQIDAETAVETARADISEREIAELSGVEVTERTETIENTADGVKATVKYKCRENIAREDLLLIYGEE